MDINWCFEPDCEFEAEYVCKCVNPWTYSCKQHAGEHLGLPNKAHAFELIFKEPCEGTKEVILGFLTKEKLENIKLKRNTLASFSQYLLNSEKYIKELIKNLDYSSDQISDCCLKIEEAKKISKPMQDPILELLSLQPNEAVKKVKMMIPNNSDWYESAKLFCGLSEKISNMIESFIKDKFEVHLDKRLSKIEHSKVITQANSELSNILTSADTLFSFSHQNVKEQIKLKRESEASLFNSQINTIINDLNSKLKEANVLDTLRNKAAEILRGPNNPELEMDVRTICSIYQDNPILYSLVQAYQDCLKAYQQKTSLYNITRDWKGNISLWVYSTETETIEFKNLLTPGPLDMSTCMTQLPNGKLFCFSNYPPSGITVLIDLNGGVEVLPSGTPCFWSSCICFNNSVYCFGGRNEKKLTLSSRFDLDRNQWIQLTPMPKADLHCNSIIFNGDILISGFKHRNLLLYSIDIDSFSTIPYKFAERERKILINLDRLYLIECPGQIYESEIGSYMNWRRIGESIIDYPLQVYWSYNKGGICIAATTVRNHINLYEFNLKEKTLAYCVN